MRRFAVVAAALIVLVTAALGVAVVATLYRIERDFDRVERELAETRRGLADVEGTVADFGEAGSDAYLEGQRLRQELSSLRACAVALRRAIAELQTIADGFEIGVRESQYTAACQP